VSEVDHWSRPAFRTKRRIFITLRPQEQKAMFHIPEEHQELLFEMRPEASSRFTGEDYALLGESEAGAGARARKTRP